MRSTANQHVLGHLRQILGMGQKELAELINCSLATVQSVEVDRLKLSDKLAQKIHLATGVSPGWLLENNLSKPPVSYCGEPYTKETFEQWQTRRHATTDWKSTLPLVLLNYYAIMRRVVDAAAQNGSDSVALYRLGKFLEDFADEFGDGKVGGLPFYAAEVLELAALDVQTALRAFKMPSPPLTSEQTARNEVIHKFLKVPENHRELRDQATVALDRYILPSLGDGVEMTPEEALRQFAEHLSLPPGVPFTHPEFWSYKHLIPNPLPAPPLEGFPVATLPAISPKSSLPPQASPKRGSEKTKSASRRGAPSQRP